MQVVAQDSSSAARCALVRFRGGATTLETPGYLAYTHRATLPHLTADNLALLPPPSAINFTIASCVEKPSLDILNAYGRGIAEFTHLERYPSLLSIHDMCRDVPSQSSRKTGVSVEGACGRRLITVDHLIATSRAFHPDIIVSPGDVLVPGPATTKRNTTSVTRTSAFLAETLDRLSEQQTKPLVFASIVGHTSAPFRTQSATNAAQHASQLTGFFIEGLARHPLLTHTQRTELLRETLSVLPRDTHLCAADGCSHPRAIVDAIACGVDLFDSFYAHEATERGAALLFPISVNSSSNSGSSTSTSTSGSSSSDTLDLTDPSFVTDMRPILPHCPCHACTNYSRAYIHHLLLTKELLAGVLLSMHNLHHFGSFFVSLRSAISSGSFDSLRTHIHSYFDSLNDKSSSQEQKEEE